MATSPQPPFFGRQSIRLLLFEPLYNGHLSTTPTTFICPQDDRCGENQLYFLKLRSHALVLS